MQETGRVVVCACSDCRGAGCSVYSGYDSETGAITYATELCRGCVPPGHDPPLPDCDAIQPLDSLPGHLEVCTKRKEWPAGAESFNEIVRSLLEARRLLDWALDDTAALAGPEEVVDTFALHVEEAKAKLDEALEKLRE